MLIMGIVPYRSVRIGVYQHRLCNQYVQQHFVECRFNTENKNFLREEIDRYHIVYLDDFFFFYPRGPPYFSLINKSKER